MAQNDTPALTLEWAEAQEKYHLGRAEYHQGKAKSFAVIKQAILDVTAPEPGTGHDVPYKGAAPMMGAVPSGTKKWNCLDILGTLGPLSTQDIVVQLNKRGFADSNQPNTSPQLSLYRMQGFIGLNGSIWHLTTKGREFVAAEKN